MSSRAYRLLIVFIFAIITRFDAPVLSSSKNPYLAANRQPAQQESKNAQLFVDTVPNGARIRILNIRPVFKQGITLDPGKYHIEVSAKGYQTKKEWIAVGKGEIKRLEVSLERPVLPEKSRVETLFRIHTVGDGETLWGITARYGVSLPVIMQFNNLSDPSIYVGQQLRVPLIPAAPKDLDPERQAEAGKYLQFGYLALDSGEFKQAITFYNRALRANPYSMEAHYGLGFAYFKLDIKTEAVEAFKQAVEINPYDAEAYYNLGLAYFVVDNKDAAVENHEILKILDPQLADRLLQYIQAM